MSDLMNPRTGVLRRATALINGVRQDTYGEPVENFSRIAAVWSAVLNQPVTAQQVALCMAGLKMIRATTSPGHGDSYDDGAGYLALAYECVVRK